MVRKTFGGVLFAMLVASALGCGGYSDEKAKTRCDQERFAKSACMTDTEYEECMACYKECGDSCEPLAKCPEAYSCDDPGAGQ